MDLLYARWQMGLSLAFHIIFAVIGMAMPVMMVVAEAAWLRTARPEYLDLAKRWARGTAILFAVGAVSGTVLSFELGLLWPAFMELAGPVIGMPFSLEGFAFFLEAIFLGSVSLRLAEAELGGAPARRRAGVDRRRAVRGLRRHRQRLDEHAVGFRLDDGKLVEVDPLAAMLNPAAGAQVVHMLLAAYAAVGVAVAGIHARMLSRDPANAFHRRAFAIALVVGLPAALLQPLSGDWAARVVARTQPAKLAALEGQFATEAGAPLRIGGIPDVSARETRYALEIPGGLSWAAYGDRSARVTGLDDIPRELWPPVAAVHVAFQVMVAIGMLARPARAVGGVLVVAGSTVRVAAVSPGGGLVGGPRLRRDRSGMDGHRARPTALDHSGGDEDRRGRDAHARPRSFPSSSSRSSISAWPRWSSR